MVNLGLLSLVSWPSSCEIEDPFRELQLQHLKEQIENLRLQTKSRKLRGLVSRKEIKEVTSFTVEEYGWFQQQKAIAHVQDVGETIGCRYVLVTKAGTKEKGYNIEGKFYSYK